MFIHLPPKIIMHTPSITHVPALGKYCNSLVNSHVFLEGWFIGKKVEAQSIPFLKSHRQKGLGLRFESRQSNSTCQGSFNTSAFQMDFFFKSKESVKNENVFGNPTYKADKVGAFKNYLNGIVGCRDSFFETSLALIHPTVAPENLSQQPGTLRDVILKPRGTTLSLDFI